MPPKTFDEAVIEATASRRPAARGVACLFKGARPSLQEAADHIAPVLPGWSIHEIDPIFDWFEIDPPEGDRLTLAGAWTAVRALRDSEAVAAAEPLLLVASPLPANRVEAESFAMGFGREQFGFWGQPYDRETESRIAATIKDSQWHLRQLRVPEAWEHWKASQPEGRDPGHAIQVGHPDTGYSVHLETENCFLLPGRSFLEGEPDSGLDDLRNTARPVLHPKLPRFPQFPGHGTSTASVIASGSSNQPDGEHPEVVGVAPGARVLPLRVSRSVVHFDFGNVAKAILHAVREGVDVISMSLGGPTFSEQVRDAIRIAHQQGVIVVSAAGNYLPVTVFPAAFPEVIGVAATNAAETPWRFSGQGRLVDIAAPGEDVWHARSERDAAPNRKTEHGDGTSFATACVAGLAALWLSYHGGREQLANTHYGGRTSLIPFAFQYALVRSANNTLPFVARGKHGAGLADALALLKFPLPTLPEVERYERLLRAQPVHRLTFVTGLFSGGMGVTDETAASLTAGAVAEAGSPPSPLTPAETEELRRLAGAGPVDALLADGDSVTGSDAVRRPLVERLAEEELLRGLLGEVGTGLDEEFLARVASDRVLLTGFQRLRQGESPLPLLNRLLGRGAGPAEPPEEALSPQLLGALEAARGREEARLRDLHRARLPEVVTTTTLPLPGRNIGERAQPGVPPAPADRLLRAYAFDPSLATRLDTSGIHQVTIPVRWENVEPGPVGEYVEVIDVDPSSGCAYAPVDLNHPYILAQDGLPPSEGSPQFHQQMVYAVTMNTIGRFELALGRPLFWAALRPWLDDRPDEKHLFTPEALPMVTYDASGEPRERDRYVRRLRVYPHALREANAYYSPQKRAILFGYFPAADGDSGKHYPGGMVFTCLSHDIIVHETTHAILDGMHPFFNEPSNPDVWAFHEAFADIIALFQHFTYPEVLRNQIASTRGDLETQNLLGELAQEFGRATGGHGALRSYLGSHDEAGRWQRAKPNPKLLSQTLESHARGSVLVAAVFDAFLELYQDQVADLLRLYTGGTGVLPAGSIHPDLVNRLALEAARAAEEVLRACIRAMDYVPPVDITFGEFLRALITADYELSPGERRTRVAFIDAFRSWGIYPRDVSALSEDSLRWRAPDPEDPLQRLDQQHGTLHKPLGGFRRRLRELAASLERWQPGCDRADVFAHILQAQGAIHERLEQMQAALGETPLLPGLDLREGASFSVGNLRPARRIGRHGEFRTEMVFEVTQTYRPRSEHRSRTEVSRFRGGATLVVDLQSWEIRYVIRKRLYDELPKRPGHGGVPTDRHQRQVRFDEERGMGVAGAALVAWDGEDEARAAEWLAATYDCRERREARRKKLTQNEPFALLHRALD